MTSQLHQHTSHNYSCSQMSRNYVFLYVITFICNCLKFWILSSSLMLVYEKNMQEREGGVGKEGERGGWAGRKLFLEVIWIVDSHSKCVLKLEIFLNIRPRIPSLKKIWRIVEYINIACNYKFTNTLIRSLEFIDDFGRAELSDP